MPDDGVPLRGPVSEELRAEYGALELWHTTVSVAHDAAAAGRARLLRLSDGYRGADVVQVHGRLAAHAGYRAFARGVGLDPDLIALRPAVAAAEAVVAGRLRATGTVPDALVAVAVTSGVPVVALDARVVAGAPGLRVAAPGERLGRGRRARRAAPVPAGSIVVADDRGPLALLLADPPPEHDGARARRVVLYAVGVPDVDPLEVSEAVWNAARFLTGT